MERPHTRRLPIRAAALALALAATLPTAAGGGEEAASVECAVTYEAADGLFVDAGQDQGLQAGDRGTVRRDGAEIAQVEVQNVSKGSALLRVLSVLQRPGPKPGDRVQLTAHPAAPREAEPSASPTLKDLRREEEAFTPLLSAPGHRNQALGAQGNIFHGQLRLRELYQVDPKGDSDYSITRLDSSGSLQRIARGPWALDWSGELSYRTGEALEDVQAYETLRFDLFRLSLFRRFDDQSSVRAGRFVPWTLPAVGYLDGVQMEKTLGSHLRAGLMAGLKPTRYRLYASTREPTAVPYVSLEAGDPEGLFYNGTAGILGSLYDGDPDRLAALLDQTIRFGSRFTLYTALQVDFDVGSRETRPATQLTQLDVSASYEVIPGTTLRAGVDHYERLDSQAERDALPVENPAYFDAGFWRYWIGAGQRLPLSLTLAGEVALIESSWDDTGPQWRATLTRAGLPWMPAGSLTVSVYNFQGFETDGYGTSISGFFPLVDDRLTLEAWGAYRSLQTSVDGGSFGMSDVGGRLNWNLSKSWTLMAGGTYSVGGGLERFLVDVGITYRW